MKLKKILSSALAALMLFSTVDQVQVSYATDKQPKASSMYALDNTGVDTSSILEINMHDYLGDDYKDKPKEVINQYPINANRPFTFQFAWEDLIVYPNRAEFGGIRWWNNYTQHPAKNPPQRYQKGIYDNVLHNGYPALSKATGNYGYSLSYLFDNNSNAAGVGKHFKNLNKLFIKDKSTKHLTLDSSQDYVLLQSDGTFAHDAENGPTRNTFTPLDSVTGHTEKSNMWFGMDVRGQFTMPVGKQVNGKDMLFEFAGDDDMLVYIDDVLVLDLGGIHSNVTGSINFTTGQVEEMWRTAMYEQNEHGFLYHSISDSFKAAGKTWDDSEYSEHTIKIFYLERGYGDSNCKIKMNLPFDPLPDKPTGNYNVTYKPNGGNGSDQIQKVSIGNPWVTKGDIFNKSGYVLESWNTRLDGKGTRYELNSTQSAITKDLTLYAQWKQVSLPTDYTVTYKANGGIGSDQYQTVKSNNSWTTKGDVFTKSGYILESWNTDPNGRGVKFELNKTQQGLNENLTLYAQWKKSGYTVTYKANDGSSSSTNQTVTYDSPWTTKGAIFSRPGYTLTSWNTRADGKGTRYSLSAAQGNWKSSSNLTLYAQWTPHTLTIRYHLNGAKDNPNDGSFEGGDPAATVSYNYKDGLNSYGLTDLTTDRVTPPAGYHIQGTWNTQPDRTGKAFDFTTVYKLEELNSSILTGNATVDLYGQYDINGYTIEFNGNGATGGSTPSINATYNQTGPMSRKSTN